MDFSSYLDKHKTRKNAILALHAGESETNAWYTRRLLGVGGSEVASVLNLDMLGHKTPFDVWRKKTGQDNSNFSNRFTLWGHILEDIVARHFSDVTGFGVAKCNKHFSMKSAPWMVGNIDRAIIMDGKKCGVLECKTSSAYNDHKFNLDAAWYANDEFFDENKHGITDKSDIPLNYYLQCQHYMMVTGFHMCYLAVLIGGNDYRIFNVPFNETDAKYIYAGCSEFWCHNVLDGIPPEPTSADYVKTFFQNDEKTAVADSETLEIVRAYNDINAQISALDKQKDELKSKLITAIGSAASLVLPNGQKLATLKASNRSTVDVDAMDEQERQIYNELVSAYTVKKLSESRTLRVTYKEK